MRKLESVFCPANTTTCLVLCSLLESLIFIDDITRSSTDTTDHQDGVPQSIYLSRSVLQPFAI